jgi:hypothetical protein
MGIGCRAGSENTGRSESVARAAVSLAAGEGDPAGHGDCAHSPGRSGGKKQEKIPRQRVAFAIEIHDGQKVGSHLQTKTQDIAGSGCYVETMQPLPLKKILDVTFWLNSERVQTTAIVRTCDGGVGMGLEFIGLDEATQNQLQQLVEALAAESVPFTHAQGAL